MKLSKAQQECYMGFLNSVLSQIDNRCELDTTIEHVRLAEEQCREIEIELDMLYKSNMVMMILLTCATFGIVMLAAKLGFSSILSILLVAGAAIACYHRLLILQHISMAAEASKIECLVMAQLAEDLSLYNLGMK